MALIYFLILGHRISVEKYRTYVPRYQELFRFSYKSLSYIIAIINRVAHLLMQMFPGLGFIPNKRGRHLSGHRHCLPICEAISQCTACEEKTDLYHITFRINL